MEKQKKKRKEKIATNITFEMRNKQKTEGQPIVLLLVDYFHVQCSVCIEMAI